jgi:2-iminoacetate synthase
MTYFDLWKQQDWDDIRCSIYSKTTKDVERILVKKKWDLEDVKVLLSPAAGSYLEPLAKRSVMLTRQRFGYTMGLFIPLYLSNLCANVCSYCGFSMENKIKRHTLSMDALHRECQILKTRGFQSVLLVTGEHTTKVGMVYFQQALSVVRHYFEYIAMEVQPLDKVEYDQLKVNGLNGVMVYQETYHSRTYAMHHKKGKKQDFQYRLETPDRLGQANVDKIGLGSLLGLSDWRVDAWFAAHHLSYLQKRYWRSRFSLSLPRLRPCVGGISPASIVTDKNLVQLLSVYRGFSPNVEISLSTRENANLRDHILPLGFTHLSAGSKTEPGGYSDPNRELAQFEVGDERAVEAVVSVLRQKGLDPVWRDWHRSYSG